MNFVINDLKSPSIFNIICEMQVYELESDNNENNWINRRNELGINIRLL